MNWLLAVVAATGSAAAAARWLRVAQREHYLGGVTRFAVRWWGVDWRNRTLAAAGLAAAVATAAVPALGYAAVAAAVIGPIGLALVGRTAPLVWTARLGRLAALLGGEAALVIAAGLVSEADAILAFLPLAVPALTDVALRILAPIERRLGQKWIEQAARSLERIRPRIVAITGSFGKTSTKHLVAHILGETCAVVASPASFNNRLGLARAVNEHLAPGTEVFVAEMGTYGVGEIRELCGWIPPDVAVITALGPVHLERMRTIETIAAAKREILERAPVAVVAVDHPILASIADTEAAIRRIIRVSGEGAAADVSVDADGSVWVDGLRVGAYRPTDAHPTNVACAVGAAIGLDVPIESIVGRLADLPQVPHRRAVGRSELGFDIVDDTFNSNPAGARAALDLLAGLGRDGGRRVVVTPGMVELGLQQRDANRRLMADAAEVGTTDVVVVGRTNRPALLAGAREAGIDSVIVVGTRDDAVRWIRETLTDGDAVLYENDLPDHYP